MVRNCLFFAFATLLLLRTTLAAEAIEWAGIFNVSEFSKYTWSMQKVGGMYAASTQLLVIIPTAEPIESTMISLEDTALSLMNDGSCNVFKDRATLTPATEGSCFELHAGTSATTTFTIDTTDLEGIAIYAQHLPTSFQHDTHYFTDITGKAMEPVASKDVCKQMILDFIIKDSDPEVAAVEDDIVKDLAKVGIKVKTRVLSKAEYIAAEDSGDYHLMFTRTWGAPYDPHSYLTSWEVPAHVEYSALGGLEAPLTREGLFELITNVQKLSDPLAISAAWEEIHQTVHSQAMFLPLWGTRIPYVLNRRFYGFTPSTQTYAYPLESVGIQSGSKNVTIAPGSGGSLFSSVGPVNPHTYFPNQLFVQSWVYEGLVGYGQDGEITPVLATSWTRTGDSPTGGDQYVFTLRENVLFHDGSEWNCSVAKLNFDHVLGDAASRKRHSWFGTAKQLTSWTCNDQGQFVLETQDKYYPLLQELTYIRPLTFASASAFSMGLDSDPVTHNSCEAVANVTNKGSDIELEAALTCAGLSAPIGTGPFKLHNRVNEGAEDLEAVFARHDTYWGAVPAIEYIHLKYYESQDDVFDALLDETLDMALGIGPLAPAQVQKLKFYHSNTVDVRHSDVMQHALLIMNTNASGTNDIKTRQAIIHGVDKSRFLNEEFSGLEQPVTQLLPTTAPYCNVDLNPKWAFDFSKAKLLNCPSDTIHAPPALPAKDDGLPGWAIALIVVSAVLCVSAVAFASVMYYREKQGTPMFTRLDEANINPLQVAKNLEA